MPGDDLYWNPVDLEADDSYQEKQAFIDPWDLENYDYIRNHLDYMDLSSDPSVPSGSSGEFGETHSHSFHYVPGYGKPGPPYIPALSSKHGYDSLVNDQENYAAIDEVGVYGRRARSEMSVPMSRRRIMDEYDSDSEEVSPYAEGTAKGNSVFGIYDENGIFRKVVLPVTNSKSPRDRSLSFSYGDYDYDVYNSRRESQVQMNGNPNDKEPTYVRNDEIRINKKPDNFGLSKYGHLKIDYSYSWNNLNKYIKYN